MWPKERPYPRNTGGKWKHDALTKTSAWESSLSGLEAEPMSRYLLPFKNAKTCLQSLSISKNNGLVSVFKTIFSHWNCFLSAVASDGRDGHGNFKVLRLLLQKLLKNIIMVCANWWNVLEIFVIVSYLYLEDFCVMLKVVSLGAGYLKLLNCILFAEESVIQHKILVSSI